ncbi:hypothetical protein M0R04_04710 [Candidatus Dojkabacteria bacterium]|jgi:hypothetical protein|nr:hypothetical protein [Candidatus Dojkabacteria bacterium]
MYCQSCNHWGGHSTTCEYVKGNPLNGLFKEISKRAYQEDADGVRPGGGHDFTVTITSEMWNQIKNHIKVN